MFDTSPRSLAGRSIRRPASRHRPIVPRARPRRAGSRHRARSSRRRGHGRRGNESPGSPLASTHRRSRSCPTFPRGRHGGSKCSNACSRRTAQRRTARSTISLLRHPRYLPLALRDHPVLDADLFTSVGLRAKARDHRLRSYQQHWSRDIRGCICSTTSSTPASTTATKRWLMPLLRRLEPSPRRPRSDQIHHHQGSGKNGHELGRFGITRATPPS